MRYVRGDTSPKKERKLKAITAQLKNRRGRPCNRQLQSAIVCCHRFMASEKEAGGLIIPLKRVR